jgi:tRNA dimethylallyltransferase
VGKTALVVELAREHPLEVISLDSRQVYRGLRIGTAQPDDAERDACPHHLVGFLSPQERYSAQAFRRDFAQAAADVLARGRIPVLVGGAGLYLQAVVHGLFPFPDGDARLPAIRAGLDALDDAELRARLAAADPASHARIPTGDRYRAQRALEILALTGETMTALTAAQRPEPCLDLRFETLCLDRDRAELRRRIDRRTRRMLAAGWLDEIEALRARHDDACPGLATLGYAELIAGLRGETTLAAAVERVVLHTGQYAKRQQTWFKARPHLLRGSPDDPAVRTAAHALLARADAALRAP